MYQILRTRGWTLKAEWSRDVHMTELKFESVRKLHSIFACDVWPQSGYQLSRDCYLRVGIDICSGISPRLRKNIGVCICDVVACTSERFLSLKDKTINLLP